MIIFNIKRIVKQRSSVIFSGDYINSNQSSYKKRINKINETEFKIKELLNNKDNLFKSFSFYTNILKRNNN